MAIMCPESPAPNTKSKAEKKLFKRIRDEVSDDWIVLHSLGITTHNQKPWAEIDFVLIGPSGVFCLEVKGGRVDRRDGVWIYTNDAGQDFHHTEGPFAQVGGATAALYNYLSIRSRNLKRSMVGYAVATPDVTFSVSGPDIEPDLVYDELSAEDGFGAFLNRVADHWRLRIASQRGGRSPGGLSDKARSELFRLVRSDFGLVSSIRSRARQATDNLLRLTEEQDHVMTMLSENPRILVRGSAGTGKTVLATEEARRASASGRKTLFMCYNRRLASLLSSEFADDPNVHVSTFHSYVAGIVARAGLRHTLPNASDSDLLTKFMPLAALDVLLDRSQSDLFEVVIVDEAQDLLLSDYLDVIDASVIGGILGGSWRLFYDPRQDLFGSIGVEVQRRLDLAQPIRLPLDINCRNTEPVAVTTALLSGMSPTQTVTIDGPPVDEVWCRDEEQEVRAAVKKTNQLLSAGIQPEDIVVLSPTRGLFPRLQQAFAGAVRFGLQEWSLDVEKPAIRFSTIAAFKGLESQAVLIMGISSLTETDSVSSLYVACSRCITLLTVFLQENLRKDHEQLSRDFGRRIATELM